MKIEFRKLLLEDAEHINKYVCDNECCYGWENDFGMIWAWNVFDTTQICVLEDMTLILTYFNEKYVFFPPYLKDCSLSQKAMEIISDYCYDNNIELDVRGLSLKQTQSLDKTKFSYISERDSSDYIYLASDLIELKGKKFHSKRNYFSRFSSQYSYSFREYNSDDFDSLMTLYDNWYKSSQHETMDLEKIAVKKALLAQKFLDLKIGILEVDNKIVGFSVGRVANNKIAHIYFEKGDIAYDGVYQVINKLSAETFYNNVILINRQEDLGIEGLRKAKLSYNPHILYEKFNIKRC